MGRLGDRQRALVHGHGKGSRVFLRPGDCECCVDGEPRLKRKERKHGKALVIHTLDLKDIARYVKMHDTQLRQRLKGAPGLYEQVKKIQNELSRPDREQAALEAAIAEHDRGARI